MATYAAVSDIQGEFKNITFSTSTSVPTANVTRFLDEADAEINAKIGQIYETPIDSTNNPISFKILRHIEIDLVASRIKAIVEVKSTDDKTNQSSKLDPMQAARDRIQEIVDRKLPLPDASLLSTGKGATGYLVGSTYSAQFQRDKKQW